MARETPRPFRQRDSSTDLALPRSSGIGRMLAFRKSRVLDPSTIPKLPAGAVWRTVPTTIRSQTASILLPIAGCAHAFEVAVSIQQIFLLRCVYGFEVMDTAFNRALERLVRTEDSVASARVHLPRVVQAVHSPLAILQDHCDLDGHYSQEKSFTNRHKLCRLF